MKHHYDRKTGYVFGGASGFWFVFIAIAFAVWGSLLFVQPDTLTRTLLVGAGTFFLGLCLRLSYYGTQIDPKNRKIREYMALLGIRTGDWRNLPNLKKLRFTSNTTRFWNSPNGISPTLAHTYTIYSIGLFSHAATPGYVIKLQSKREALQDVETLSTLLQLEIEERL